VLTAETRPFRPATDETESTLSSVYTPVEVSPSDIPLMTRIGELRVRAWKARQPDFPDMTIWLDMFDASARHWAILQGAVPVAAARMTVHNDLSEVPNAEIFTDAFPNGLAGSIASINRLVVDPAFAGRGLSRMLDEVRVSAARRENCAHMIAKTDAGTRRTDALRALGFEPAGTSQRYASGPLAEIKNGQGGGDILMLKLP
jgi:GNAT superfamily N-acetyltransferase